MAAITAPATSAGAPSAGVHLPLGARAIAISTWARRPKGRRSLLEMNDVWSFKRERHYAARQGVGNAV